MPSLQPSRHRDSCDSERRPPEVTVAGHEVRLARLPSLTLNYAERLLYSTGKQRRKSLKRRMLRLESSQIDDNLPHYVPGIFCRISSSAIEDFLMWRRFENGETICKRGSEGGVILRDEEIEALARITLERDCSHGVPFAVTCGVYGWFFHTRLLGSETEAEFANMCEGLAAIVNIVPQANDPDADSKMGAVSEAIHRFVDRFP